MIRTGTATAPCPEVPQLLPGLAGPQLHQALGREEARLVFLAEHLEHPMVPEGVADGIHDALAAIRNAKALQSRLVYGDAQ